MEQQYTLLEINKLSNYKLEPGSVYLIGKSNEKKSQQCITIHDESLDIKHALIEVNIESVTLIDLQSTNGTFLNGQKLNPLCKTVIDTTSSVQFGNVEANLVILKIQDKIDNSTRIPNECLAEANDLNKLMEKTNDVFVSYTKFTDLTLAKFVKMQLYLRGFSTIISNDDVTISPVETIKSISKSKYFVLIISTIENEQETNTKRIQEELIAANQAKCKIIPIIDKWYQKPVTSLNNVQEICNLNKIYWVHDYENACMEKIERLMRGELL
ncbi:NAD(+) hydrolase sarm1-like [Teleopsis dalmanni]|uniref:NAD(+) hydrolase sarm1-like n=1 Tax=Teleopsis dalmanni TaxID=139649 RepID=UPI000D3299F9|nr:NAD(+) hydrolase sarm1-like [Teleopsis dalmanni]XP_037935676.1 NAD(+) hydrolase sarm1-like [Teleopsis dalmanni]